MAMDNPQDQLGDRLMTSSPPADMDAIGENLAVLLKIARSAAAYKTPAEIEVASNKIAFVDIDSDNLSLHARPPLVEMCWYISKVYGVAYRELRATRCRRSIS